MRQNTFLTTRGRFLVGFRVSPAVIAMDSVPPSTITTSVGAGDGMSFKVSRLTGECSSHEYGCETTNAADKRSTWDTPVLAADVMVVNICTTVYCDGHDDEHLKNRSQVKVYC
jgi:hypothetical protein